MQRNGRTSIWKKFSFILRTQEKFMFWSDSSPSLLHSFLHLIFEITCRKLISLKLIIIFKGKGITWILQKLITLYLWWAHFCSFCFFPMSVSSLSWMENEMRKFWKCFQRETVDKKHWQGRKIARNVSKLSWRRQNFRTCLKCIAIINSMSFWATIKEYSSPLINVP